MRKMKAIIKNSLIKNKTGRKTSNKKKGITLIEIIVSLAILAIIVVPISTMILTSVKINKEGGDKQKATFIGQEISEEIKSLANLNGTLSNGLIFNLDTNGNYTNTNFPLSNGSTLNISISKNNNLNFSNTLSNTPAYLTTLNITVGASNIVANGDTPVTANNDMYIDIYNDPATIKIYGGSNSGGTGRSLITTFNKPNNPVDNNIKINLLQYNGTNSNTVTINTYNSDDSKTLNLYINKSSTDIKCSINNSIGSLKEYNNVADESYSSYGNSYNINLSIWKKGSKLYENSIIKAIG